MTKMENMSPLDKYKNTPEQNVGFAREYFCEKENPDWNSVPFRRLDKRKIESKH